MLFFLLENAIQLHEGKSINKVKMGTEFKKRTAVLKVQMIIQTVVEACTRCNVNTGKSKV